MTKKSILFILLLTMFSFNACDENEDINLVGSWVKICQKYNEAQYYKGEVRFTSDNIIESQTNYYEDSDCNEVSSLEENIVRRTYKIGNETKDVRGEEAIELDTFIANTAYYRMFRIQNNRLYLSVTNDPFDGSTQELRANKFVENDYFTR